jgi:osmotically-inducible protein OsmY
MKNIVILLLLCQNLLLVACTHITPRGPEITEQLLLEERRSREVILSDRMIEAEAYSELNSERDLIEQCHININAFNGTVLVTGQAPSEELSKKIITIIQAVSNVKLVHNNLFIGYPSDIATRSNDELITESVKTALNKIRSIPDFYPSMIKVTTENSTVYLMGLVNREEGTIAVKITKLQPGIKQIVTVFEYLD